MNEMDEIDGLEEEGFGGDPRSEASRRERSARMELRVAAERSRRKLLWAWLLDCAERLDASIAAELRWAALGELDDEETIVARAAAARCAEEAGRLAAKVASKPEPLAGLDVEEGLALCRARLLAARERARAAAASLEAPRRGPWKFGPPRPLDDEDSEA